MKNLKIIIALLVVIFGILIANISFADTGIVNTPALRIREKADKSSSIVTRVYEDDEVEILEEDGDWYKVKVKDKTGYARKDLIKRKETSSNNTVSENTNTAENVTSDANNEVKPANNVVANTNSTSQNTTTSNTTEPEENSNTTQTSKTKIKEDTVARIMPNFASNEWSLLNKETEVEVVREINNWAEVLIQGKRVWVLKNKIQMGEVAPEEPSAPKPDEQTPAENTVPNENNTVKPDTTNTTTNETRPDNTNTTTKPDNTNTATNTTTANTSENKNTKGIVKVETANVRAKASKSSKIVDTLDENDKVTIVEEDGDWYKITNSKIESGYVSKNLIRVADVSSRGDIEARGETSKQLEPEEIKEVEIKKVEIKEVEIPEPEVNKGQEVVDYAKQFLGCDYVLGGTEPETGVDCSGYTRYVYKNFGYTLGKVAAEQNSLGEEIAREDLKEGDLILFHNEANTKIGHTGIYIGNDEFIHSANPERGIVIDNLVTNSYYSTRFVTARRIVE